MEEKKEGEIIIGSAIYSVREEKDGEVILVTKNAHGTQTNILNIWPEEFYSAKPKPPEWLL